jgi:hypothetical protein
MDRKLKVISPIKLTEEEERYREIVDMVKKIADPHSYFKEVLDKRAFQLRAIASKELQKARTKFKRDNIDYKRRITFQETILKTIKNFAEHNIDEDGKLLLFYYLENTFGFKTMMDNKLTVFSFPNDSNRSKEIGGLMSIINTSISVVSVRDIMTLKLEQKDISG